MSVSDVQTEVELADKMVSQIAATIYTQYISRGLVEAGKEASWMQRSIREAVRDTDLQHHTRPAE
jgi:hypothetical protein